MWNDNNDSGNINDNSNRKHNHDADEHTNDNTTATLQGINTSHLGKRKIIFKMPFWGDMLVPWRVILYW